MQRFGLPPKSDETYRRRPGVYAILARGKDVLLTYQAGIHHEFQLPGGGVDPGEQPIAALHREVLEETAGALVDPPIGGAISGSFTCQTMIFGRKKSARSISRALFALSLIRPKRITCLFGWRQKKLHSALHQRVIRPLCVRLCWAACSRSGSR